MINNYDLFLESSYFINLDTGPNDYPLVARDTRRQNRLKYKTSKIERKGGSRLGEQISEILFNATNQNVIDTSHPFVDLRVLDDIENVAVKNEYISVKTSFVNHSLRTSVGTSGGFKIGQLILFALDQMNFRVYKTSDFKIRHSWQTYVFTTYLEEIILKLFSNNVHHYKYAFLHSLLIFKIILDYLKLLRKDKDPMMTDINDLKAVVAVIAAKFVDAKYTRANYFGRIETLEPNVSEFIQGHNTKIQNYIRDNKLTIHEPRNNSWVREILPIGVRNIKISYCVIYFDKEENNRVILNVYKTKSLKFEDLFINTLNEWSQREYHIDAVNVYRRDRKKIKTLILNFDGVCAAFQNNGISDQRVFDTHIQIDLSLKHERDRRKIGTKMMYIKTINNIKGINSDEKEKDILRILNKSVKLLDVDDVNKKNARINAFSEFIDNLSTEVLAPEQPIAPVV